MPLRTAAILARVTLHLFTATPQTHVVDSWMDLEGGGPDAELVARDPRRTAPATGTKK